MIQLGLKIALAAIVLITSTPHALCPCGKTQPSAERARPRMCPYCHTSSNRPATRSEQPGPQKPCSCGTCEVTPAVVSSAAEVSAPTSVAGTDGVVLERAMAVVADLPPAADGRAAAPPGSPTVAGLAIPLFLGRLLI